MMTRTEHIKWIKDRAKQEYEYYINEGKGHHKACENAVTSIMSDLGKHPETQSTSLQSLCLMMLTSGQLGNKATLYRFIDGFN